MGFLQDLMAQEIYNEAEQQWQFADGSPCVECTRSAEQVARCFHGKVIGYWAAHNPTVMIGSKFGEGHDFAIVEDRWLVDYWAWQVTGLLDDPILGLEDPNAQVLTSRLYGHDSRWTSIH